MPTNPKTDPLRFAYWVPNVSGGLVTSTIEQRTDWSFEYNRKLARLAERAGFDYALSQVRYTASYGAEYQHESTSFSLALLLATERLKLIAAVHPGLWHPGVLAKWVATASHLSNGRAAVNVVSGWFKDEFRQLGEPWLEHDERYRRSGEFIRALREIWTSDAAGMPARQRRIGMHQLDYGAIGEVAMLFVAAADRQYRFELQTELFAVEFLHRRQLIGEESDVNSLPR